MTSGFNLIKMGVKCLGKIFLMEEFERCPERYVGAECFVD